MDTIRTVHGRNLCFVGQLVYEHVCGGQRTVVDAFSGVGVRLYRLADSDQSPTEFLCVESAETGEEKWYRIDGASLAPIDLEGVAEHAAPPSQSAMKPW